MSGNSHSYKRWSFRRRALYLLLTPFLPRIIRFLFRFEVNGIENLEKFPEGRGIIFCINHQSHLDGFMVISAILTPFGPRKFLGFIASGKILLGTLPGRILLTLGAIPIFRENPKPALDYASKSTLEGFAVLITPQGRRIYRTPFHDFFSLAEEGRSGIGRIVLTTNGKIPVMPVYIHGTSEALRPGTVIPKIGSYISISFGEPLYFEHYFRKDGWSESNANFFFMAREITTNIMHSLRNLFLQTETHYLKLLELKFNTKIKDINVSSNKQKEFNKFLHKLARVPPIQIKEFIESYYHQ
ncbi:MAG: lysophospholipid acyltransferase family protein [Candidatus Hodarchaeota archaeon]